MVKKIKDTAINGKGTIKLYWNEVRKYKISFALMVIGIPLASVLLDTATPYLLATAVGALTDGGAQSQINNYLILAAIAAGAGVLFNLLGFQSAIRHESAVRKSLSKTTISQLLAKDQTFFSNQKIGALTGKYIDFINGHVALQDLFVLRTATFAINVTLGLVLIWQQTPVLAAVVVGLILILFLQVKLSRILRMKLRVQRKLLIAETNGLAADIISNYPTVKAFAAEATEIHNLDKLNEDYRKVYIKDFKWMSFEGSARIFTMQFAQILSIFIIIGMLAADQIQIGIAIFTVAYLQRLATQLFTLGELLFGYDKIMLQAAPMTDTLMEPPMVVDNSNTKLTCIAGNIEFKNVSYSYQDDKDTKVLSNFSLKIPAGQKIGLVGQSGAGKTTITKLLLRLDDIDDGEVMIDNQNIAHVTQKSLRKCISYVPQEPMLFHRTLRENIAYGKQNVPDSEIIKAAKRANAYDFIKELPNGLSTIVGERGIKLSGGQRQRIAIARAILKDSPILVLDEATSALDSESEKLIQAALSDLMYKRTSIVIAHRLSTLAKLDRIVVIDGGTIAEDGSHAELLKLNGIYARLWSHQSGGFLDKH